MATDVYNVWDEIYSIMCVPCPNRAWCHDGVEEDVANDEQMVICLSEGQVERVDIQVVSKDEILNPLGADV